MVLMFSRLGRCAAGLCSPDAAWQARQARRARAGSGEHGTASSRGAEERRSERYEEAWR